MSESGDYCSLRQYVVTPAAGKRLIARGMAAHPVIRKALKEAVIVIVAGTTNGYVAEEILAISAPGTDFPRRRFIRGVTVPPRVPTTNGRLPDESAFPGDIVLRKGVWDKGKTIFDVVDELKQGDVILKGANALDCLQKRAAILIGHPKAGTVGAALQAAVGRRVQLILPVGLEKRVPGDLDEIAGRLNAPGATGFRLLPVSGLVFTEIDAISLLTGAAAEVVAAGGVSGAEGSAWLAVSGTPQQLEAADSLLRSASEEPAFNL